MTAERSHLAAGFLVFEAVLALALFSLCLFATIALSWGAERTFQSARARQTLLDAAGPIAADPDDFPSDFAETAYGNDASIAEFSTSTGGSASVSAAGTGQVSLDLTYLVPDTSEGYGKDSCPHDLTLPAGFPHAALGPDLSGTSAILPISSANLITDMAVRDGIAYISADSSVNSDPDLFIFDVSDPSHPALLSSLDTGPGLAALAVAGPYVFAADRSSTYQLQVIDIHDRSHPALFASAKVPLDVASSTRPYGSAVFYDKGFAYLGTEKGDSPELTVWNVADPAHPSLAGSYEVGGEVERLAVAGTLAYAASTGDDQLMRFDVSDPSHPALLAAYAPPGWQTATGEAAEIFEDSVAFGRDTGGFNVKTNPEFVLYGKGIGAQTASFDEPGGVYAIVARPPAFVILTHRSSGQLRLDDATGTTSAAYDIPGTPAAFVCDDGNMYVASNGSASLTSISDFHE